MVFNSANFAASHKNKGFYTNRNRLSHSLLDYKLDQYWKRRSSYLGIALATDKNLVPKPATE